MKLALLLLILPLSANAEPLEFSARIKSENLAEEAIDLLHCLSDRLEIPWELGEGGRASIRLKVVEKSQKLEGEFFREGKAEAFTLSAGESARICEQLAPIQKPDPNFPLGLKEDWQPEPEPAKWIWAASAVATVAVLAGGFLFWKSRQSDHRGLKMD